MANQSGAQRTRTTPILWLLLWVAVSFPLRAQQVISDWSAADPVLDSTPAGGIQPTNSHHMVEELRAAIRQQQEQIEQLSLALKRQEQLLERLQATNGSPVVTQPDSTAIVRLASAAISAPLSPRRQTAAAQESGIEELRRQVEGVSRRLGGFRFSGEFRVRFETQFRTATAVAGPLQNVRGRYNLRLNFDKQLDPRFGFRLQLATGALTIPTTNDQDMGGLLTKIPFAIAEAYVDYRPNPKLWFRAGRMEEVFSDGSRFQWDGLGRYDGFQQVVQLPLTSAPLGIEKVELRAAQYILTNPNISILPATSPFVAAGYQPGQKVRSAMLFHPGFVLHGKLGAHWSHQILGDIELYRNPNHIQLASTAAGVPVVINRTVGVSLAGPLGGVGNATTTPGGAQYYARHFQVVHLKYRLTPKAFSLWGREIPVWLDFQVSRNVGTSRLRDALVAGANVGDVRAAGNMRFLYQFFIKDANSMIGQFTDGILGTSSAVNIAVHYIRYDLGLTPFLQWQNLLYLQSQRRPSNPAEGFFVPLQRGAGRTYRYQAQLAFSF